ncbi:DUF4044 domain-containing protein [Weissella confusa]|nr:DUF4044 domain-containing protein [Weissella confusa]
MAKKKQKSTMQKVIQGFVILMLILSFLGVFITLFQVMMGYLHIEMRVGQYTFCTGRFSTKKK